MLKKNRQQIQSSKGRKRNQDQKLYGIDFFGEFFIHDKRKDENSVLIIWKKSDEDDIDYYRIYFSENGFSAVPLEFHSSHNVQKIDKDFKPQEATKIDDFELECEDLNNCKICDYKKHGGELRAGEFYYVKKKKWFIKGLPISSKAKVISVLILFFLFVINTIVPVLFEQLAYPFKDIVSGTILLLFVIVSIGSKSAEGIVIGVAVVAIVSNLWDFSIYDISDFRKNVMIGSIAILFFSIIFGEIGVLNLVRIFKKQIGAEK